MTTTEIEEQINSLFTFTGGPRKSTDPPEEDFLSKVNRTLDFLNIDEPTLYLEFKKLHEDAIIPSKNYPTDAGFDLYALEDKELWDTATPKCRTGIAINIPPGYVGLIISRSSMGAKRISILGGLVDCGYVGDVTVMLEAHTGYYNIKKGDKIAQLVILPLPKFEAKEVAEFSNNYSERKQKGFGSSGQ